MGNAIKSIHKNGSDSKILFFCCIGVLCKPYEYIYMIFKVQDLLFYNIVQIETINIKWNAFFIIYKKYVMWQFICNLKLTAQSPSNKTHSANSKWNICRSFTDLINKQLLKCTVRART